jgi:hypothetical protein
MINNNQIGSDLICIDVSLTSGHYGSNWEIGPCSSSPMQSKQNQMYAKYIEKCCISPGKHTLTCTDSEKTGWGGGFLEIQGHRYCHDFIGFTAMRKVVITCRLIAFNILVEFIYN